MAYVDKPNLRHQYKAVQLLLEKGADINAQGRSHEDVLQEALEKGHSKVVQLLVEKRADVNAQGGPYGDALQMELVLETLTSRVPRAETYITSRKKLDINDPLTLCSTEIQPLDALSKAPPRTLVQRSSRLAISKDRWCFAAKENIKFGLVGGWLGRRRNRMANVFSPSNRMPDSDITFL